MNTKRYVFSIILKRKETLSNVKLLYEKVP